MATSSFSRRELALAAAALGAAPAGNGAAQTTSITDVGNLRVGHFTDSRRPTGCTVVIFDPAAVVGVDVRGGAPGSRETDLLNPLNTVEQVNAILLTGGSAFGLDAATGVMHYLEETRRGYAIGVNIVPIVPAAVLFDLAIGDGKIRPDAAAGFQACVSASPSHVPEGSVGAGAGATVGKLMGMRSAMKSGIGTASITVGDTGIVVGALAAVNAFGDVLARNSGRILAGSRNSDGSGFLNTMQQVTQGALFPRHRPRAAPGGNTTLAVVATNARLTKTEATKVAQMAHDGFARVISPIHTPMDGDTIFAAAMGTAQESADLCSIGAVAADAVALAINRAVVTAAGILPNLPAYQDLPWTKK